MLAKISVNFNTLLDNIENKNKKFKSIVKIHLSMHTLSQILEWLPKEYEFANLLWGKKCKTC